MNKMQLHLAPKECALDKTQLHLAPKERALSLARNMATSIEPLSRQTRLRVVSDQHQEVPHDPSLHQNPPQP